MEQPTAAELLGVSWIERPFNVSLTKVKSSSASNLHINSRTCDLRLDRNPCCTTVTAENFHSVRCQMAELTHNELDLVVMVAC